MKPTFIVMLILLVGGLVIAPMLVKGPTGDPIMTAEDWVPDSVKDVAEAVKPANQAYRWKDAEGVWQFSDAKPAGVDDKDIQTIAIAEVMTVPKTAFTGNPPTTQSPDRAAGSSPTAVLISKYTGSSRGQSQVPGTSPSIGREGQGEAGQAPDVNDALAEIATRFPQFKAMSDAMAQGSSQPAGDNPESP